MKIEILQKNLNLLKKFHPDFYDAVKDCDPIKKYKVTLSNSKVFTLSYTKPNQSKIYLLSKYDPLKEAKTLISLLNVHEHINFIVLGLGLGYQVMELIKLIPNHSKIILIEPDKNLARLAIETNDLSQILRYPGLTFSITDEVKEIHSFLEKEKVNFSLNGYKIVQQNSLFLINSKFFIQIQKEIKNYFRASAIEIKTHSARSKIFYKNISENYKNVISSPGIEILKTSMENIPAIICSAGPSLDKNIQLLKTKRENFVLIAAATALNPLQECQIFPDFLVVIDPNEMTTQLINLENYVENTWLVYDPAIPAIVPTFFEGKRFVFDSPIYLAQWIQKQIGQNGSLGKVFSVAHASYNLASFMGCSPIIFVGQDLSFSKKRLHSRNSYYYQRREDQINRLETMKILEEIKFKKHSKSILQTKDIFNKQLLTTLAMETYALMFSAEIASSQETLNATEGGLGFSEVKNNSLREAITNKCITNIRKKKASLFDSITFDPLSKSKITEPAKNQLLIFKEVFQNLNDLENEFLNRKIITDEIKEKFVLEMNLTIQNLLKNKDTVLLLQGYDFLGFSLWNKNTNEILRKKETEKNINFLEEEFQRDREFFYSLKKSLEFNMKFFEDLAEELKTI